MAAAVPETTMAKTDRIEPVLANDVEKAELTPQDVTDEESGTAPSPPSPQPGKELQRWNETGLNMFRFFSTIYCFILMGMTDGAVGVCSPPSCLNRRQKTD